MIHAKFSDSGFLVKNPEYLVNISERSDIDLSKLQEKIAQIKSELLDTLSLSYTYERLNVFLRHNDEPDLSIGSSLIKASDLDECFNIPIKASVEACFSNCFIDDIFDDKQKIKSVYSKIDRFSVIEIEFFDDNKFLVGTLEIEMSDLFTRF